MLHPTAPIVWWHRLAHSYHVPLCCEPGWGNPCAPEYASRTRALAQGRCPLPGGPCRLCRMHLHLGLACRPLGTSRQTARSPSLVPPAIGAWDRQDPVSGAPGRNPYHRPLTTGPRLRLILPPRHVRQGVCGQTLWHLGHQEREYLAAVGLLGSGGALPPQ
jgi:hypothetical protein